MWAILFVLTIGYTGRFAEQDAFLNILLGMGISFLLYFLLIQKAGKTNTGILFLIATAVLARLSFIDLIPILSDDVYRFLWDGKLWHKGINPLTATPSALMQQGLVTGNGLEEIYPLLNSAEYYTIYPPLHQLVFYASTFLDSVIGSVMVMRSFIVVAEIWIIYLLLRLLRHFKLPDYWVLIYALNPLIIIELTGNLHFESFMVAFLMASFLALAKKRFIRSGLFFACSIAFKLLPLMFVPALLFYLLREGKQLHDKSSLNTSPVFLFFMSLSSALVLFFTPLFIGVDLGHFLSSINLYFQKFEFNASLYFILRELGYGLTGYNQIAVIGPLLGIGAMIIIVLLSLRKSFESVYGLINICLTCFIIYLISTTTVHPWYLALPLALNVFHPRIWLLIWSFLIVLSYSLYNYDPIPGVHLLIVMEYGLVMMFWMCEQKKIRLRV